jgi:hypothetical protein
MGSFGPQAWLRSLRAGARGGEVRFDGRDKNDHADAYLQARLGACGSHGILTCGSMPCARRLPIACDSDDKRLPAYSGATVPDLHRVPDTRADQLVWSGGRGLPVLSRRFVLSTALPARFTHLPFRFA